MVMIRGISSPTRYCPQCGKWTLRYNELRGSYQCHFASCGFERWFSDIQMSKTQGEETKEMKTLHDAIKEIHRQLGNGKYKHYAEFSRAVLSKIASSTVATYYPWSGTYMAIGIIRGMRFVNCGSVDKALYEYWKQHARKKKSEWREINLCNLPQERLIIRRRKESRHSLQLESLGGRQIRVRPFKCGYIGPLDLIFEELIEE